MICFDRLLAGLRTATLLYLALPAAIFFAGWLSAPFALALDGLLAIAIWRDVQRPAPASPARLVSLPKLLLAIALPAAALTLLSGAGGWGSGDSDWLKHDTLLRDLVERPWPVRYHTAGGPILLVYSLAFYLPAAVVGKCLGAFAAGQALALTTFIGVALAGLWLIALGDAGCPGRATVWLGAAMFFGFSGLDALGKMLVNWRLALPAFYGDWNDIEWWAQFAQYSSNAATVFWAPQHAFGGWLPAALLLDDWFNDRARLERSALMYLALALAWSPFAALGLAALLGGLKIWRLRPSWCNGAGAAAGAGFAIYLAAHFEAYGLPAAYMIPGGRHPMPLLNESHVPWLALYGAFASLEFAGLSATLFFVYRQRKSRAWGMLIAATAVLLILPWFHYGFANDLVMRGAVPALFALQVVLVRAFGLPGRRWPLVAAALLLLGGLPNTVLEYRRHVVRTIAQGSLRDARTRAPVRSLAELQRTVYARPHFDFARQYLGADDSFFGRYLARGGRGSTAPAEDKPDF